MVLNQSISVAQEKSSYVIDKGCFGGADHKRAGTVERTLRPPMQPLGELKRR